MCACACLSVTCASRHASTSLSDSTEPCPNMEFLPIHHYDITEPYPNMEFMPIHHYDITVPCPNMAHTSQNHAQIWSLYAITMTSATRSSRPLLSKSQLSPFADATSQNHAQIWSLYAPVLLVIVFGMTRPGIKPPTSQFQGGHSNHKDTVWLSSRSTFLG